MCKSSGRAGALVGSAHRVELAADTHDCIRRVTYSVLGGLRAAYWTTIQGLCIIWPVDVILLRDLKMLAQDSWRRAIRRGGSVFGIRRFLIVLHARSDSSRVLSDLWGAAAGEFRCIRLVAHCS